MSISISPNLPQPDPAKRIAQIRDAIFDGVTDGVEETANFLRVAAVQTLTNLGRVDRGTLRNSIRVSVKANRASSRVEAIVSADAFYAKWVEFGRRGSISSPIGTGPESASEAWPPVDVIRQWVRRNYKSFAPSGRTKSGKARRPKANDVDAVAFLVGRKIAQHGIKPTPFMRPALSIASPRLGPAIQRNIATRLAALTTNFGNP